MTEDKDYMEYVEWRDRLPWVTFPSHWQVKIVPPFSGAVVRFQVKTEAMPVGEFISIYFDAHDRLAPVGEPYWEIYPNSDGTNERFIFHQFSEVMDAVERAIKTRELSQ